jgi:hypothetical protein
VPNLALIALGDSHHSQGGMKFATQISPLLNYYMFFHMSHASEETCTKTSFVKSLIVSGFK